MQELNSGLDLSITILGSIQQRLEVGFQRTGDFTRKNTMRDAVGCAILCQLAMDSEPSVITRNACLACDSQIAKRSTTTAQQRCVIFWTSLGIFTALQAIQQLWFVLMVRPSIIVREMQGFCVVSCRC